MLETSTPEAPSRAAADAALAARADAAHEFRSQLASLSGALDARALRLTRNPVEAQDLVQETWMRALRFEASYQVGTNLKAWLNQVLFSVFVTRCRKLKRERRALDSLGSDPCAWTQRDPEPVVKSLSRSVQGALDSIPSQFASAVTLVDIEEKSYKEAASQLGVPVGTVMSRLFRGRRLLAGMLDDGAERQLCAA
ncbi:MAG: sigma-70 family RNA polymerase sigma factor [Myxococcales bacterium]|nr:sigma-70 family RNA polymerase sigma factor [Myxococcales bacterium]